MDDRRKPHSGGFSGRGPGSGRDDQSIREDQGEQSPALPQPGDLPTIDEPEIETAWVEEALDGDPFGIEAACHTCRDELAYLVETDRYLTWSVAAFDLIRPKGLAVEDMHDLVQRSVAQSLVALVELDEQIHQSGWAPGPDGDVRYDYIAEGFALEPGLCLAAQVRFNELRHPVRRAFFELVLHQRSIPECLKLGLGKNKQQLLHWTERAFRVLTKPEEELDG